MDWIVKWWKQSNNNTILSINLGIIQIDEPIEIITNISNFKGEKNCSKVNLSFERLFKFYVKSLYFTWNWL